MAKPTPTTPAEAAPVEAAPAAPEAAPAAAPVEAAPAAPEAAPAPEVGGYPIGVLIGVGATETVVGDLGTFVVDPETGRITGPA